MRSETARVSSRDLCLSAHRRRPLEPPLHHPAVRTRDGPEAAVGQGAILQGPPVADHRLRLLGEKESEENYGMERRCKKQKNKKSSNKSALIRIVFSVSQKVACLQCQATKKTTEHVNTSVLSEPPFSATLIDRSHYSSLIKTAGGRRERHNFCRFMASLKSPEKLPLLPCRGMRRLGVG